MTAAVRNLTSAAFAAAMALLKAPAIAMATFWTSAVFAAVTALLKVPAIAKATVQLRVTIVTASA